eukprot:1333416-Amorphochlora_amoeboformis.AAC.1
MLASTLSLRSDAPAGDTNELWLICVEVHLISLESDGRRGGSEEAEGIGREEVYGGKRQGIRERRCIGKEEIGGAGMSRTPACEGHCYKNH